MAIQSRHSIEASFSQSEHTLQNNAEFFATLKTLIDAWCDRRELSPLARLLPAYVAFNGLTDGWGDLLAALRHIQAFSRDKLTESERATLADLIHAATIALNH